MNLQDNIVSLYEKVLARKNAVLEEISSLDQKQAHLKRQLADADGFLRTYHQIAPVAEIAASPPIPATPANSQRLNKPNKQETIAKTAVEILSNGAILNTNQILDQLTERGIAVGGRNSAGNLASILSNCGKIVHSRAAKGWMLAPCDNPGQFGGGTTTSQPDSGPT